MLLPRAPIEDFWSSLALVFAPNSLPTGIAIRFGTLHLPGNPHPSDRYSSNSAMRPINGQEHRCRSLPGKPVSGAQSMVFPEGISTKPYSQKRNLIRNGWGSGLPVPAENSHATHPPGHPARCPVRLLSVLGVAGVSVFLHGWEFQVMIDLKYAPPLPWHHSICCGATYLTIVLSRPVYIYSWVSIMLPAVPPQAIFFQRFHRKDAVFPESVTESVTVPLHRSVDLKR